MTSRGLVLVHGGALGSWCWSDVVPLLELPAVCPDLPGRPGNPWLGAGEPTLSDWIVSVVAAVERSGFDDVVLVAHSIAGLLAGPVAAVASRVTQVIFVGAVVAPAGTAMIDQLPDAVRERTRARLEANTHVSAGGCFPDLEEVVTLFGSEAVRPNIERLVVEPSGIPLETAPEWSLNRSVRASYVALRRDAAVPTYVIDRSCDALRSEPLFDVEVEELDATHDVMLSNPAAIAATLNRLARVEQTSSNGATLS